MGDRLPAPEPPPGPRRAPPLLRRRPHAGRRLNGSRPGTPLPPAVLAALHVLLAARRRDLLDLEARRRLYHHVLDYPGLHLREIARGLRLDPNHAKYHLQSLERHGLVSSTRDGGYWRFYPRAAGPVGPRETLAPREKEVLALLRRPIPLHLVLLLLDRGQATGPDLRAAAGVAHSTLLYHLARLESAGVVVGRAEGRARAYRLVDPDGVLAQLLRYRPPDALVRGFLEAWEQVEVG